MIRRMCVHEARLRGVGGALRPRRISPLPLPSAVSPSTPFRPFTSTPPLARHSHRRPRGISSPASSRGASSKRFVHHRAVDSRPVVSKVRPDARAALRLSGLKSGDTLAVGGFGNGGIPETLLHALASARDGDDDDGGPSDLTVVSLTAGVDGYGLGRLYEAGRVKRMIGSYVGENKVSFLLSRDEMTGNRAVIVALLMPPSFRVTARRTSSVCSSLESSRSNSYLRVLSRRDCALREMECRPFSLQREQVSIMLQCYRVRVSLH